jgi:peptidoglycan hydrolase-like protein with peptidoglycan-binding domain
MMRRRSLVAISAVVIAGIATTTLRLWPEHASAADNTEGAAPETAAVERRDLVDRESVSGSLGYGDTTDVVSPRSGILTGLPAEGATVERGDSLFEVDGRGVPLFYGARPMWRQLAEGADDGPDIAQLEANLVALGFATAALDVDQHWTAATTAAVKAWQARLGVDQTGAVVPSDLVFLPDAVRVAEHKAAIGGDARPGEPVLGVTGILPLVTVQLDAAKQQLARAGESVRITLPDGTTIAGRVYSVGRVATAGDAQSGDTTARITVTIAVAPGAAPDNLDAAPVDVAFTRSAARHVLAVPVQALLALAEGGYAVEVVDAEGARTHLVAVTPSSFTDGWVKIAGNVHEGDRVVIAS